MRLIGDGLSGDAGNSVQPTRAKQAGALRGRSAAPAVAKTRQRLTSVMSRTVRGGAGDAHVSRPCGT
jgi:hypothetical protein